MGLALANKSNKYSGTEWKIDVFDSKEKIIRLESIGNFSSDFKLLNCAPETGHVHLAPHTSKDDVDIL